MLLDGRLDATLLYVEPSLVDRSTANLDTPAIRTLFPDPQPRRTGISRRRGSTRSTIRWSCAARYSEREPWIARSLFDAFVESKARAAAPAHGLLEPPFAETGIAERRASAPRRPT